MPLPLLQFPFRVSLPLVTLEVEKEWTKVSDATVQFEVASTFQRSSWDWVGLYKVSLQRKFTWIKMKLIKFLCQYLPTFLIWSLCRMSLMTVLLYSILRLHTILNKKHLFVEKTYPNIPNMPLLSLILIKKLFNCTLATLSVCVNFQNKQRFLDFSWNSHIDKNRVLCADKAQMLRQTNGNTVQQISVRKCYLPISHGYESAGVTNFDMHPVVEYWHIDILSKCIESTDSIMTVLG